MGIPVFWAQIRKSLVKPFTHHSSSDRLLQHQFLPVSNTDEVTQAER